MRRLLCCTAILCGIAFAAPAVAASQDFELYKLGAPGGTVLAGQKSPNERFRIFANQLGAAISSFNLQPPATLGHSAFNFAFEYAAVSVGHAVGEGSESASIWPSSGNPPSAMLLMPSVHIRKGLPFSFEIGGRISYLQYSQMTAATVELKWALNEGFLYLPDFGVRGHGTRLLGARDFGLTAAGVDLGLGKQFALGGMLTLTPYVGWDLLFVDAISSVIDFQPDRSVEQAHTDPNKNTDVFEQVRLTENSNNRFYAGLRFISSVFEVASEFSVTKGFGNQQVTAFSTKLGLTF